MKRYSRKLLVVAGLVLLHLTVIATAFYFGRSGIQKQGTFWTIFGLPFADVGLLGIYLASGRGDARVRLGLFIVGVAFAVGGLWLSGSNFLIAFAAGFLVLGFVAWAVTILIRIGRVIQSTEPAPYRFSIAEILVTTFIIAVLLATVRYLWEIEWSGWNQIADATGDGLVEICITSAFCVLLAQLVFVRVDAILRVGLGVVSVFAVISLAIIVAYLLATYRGPVPPKVYAVFLEIHLSQLLFGWIMLGSIHWAFVQPIEVAAKETESDRNSDSTLK